MAIHHSKGGILGAGLARRLDPLSTHQLSKPMFPLGGKVPIAEIWVRRFAELGIKDVSMNLCILPETIKQHFGNGKQFGVDLNYIEEETPTGTLGGVCKMALGHEAKLLPSDQGRAPAIAPFPGSTLIVPSGDIVANFGSELLAEMYDIHRKQGAALTMVLTEIPEERKGDFGTVVLHAPEKMQGAISASGKITEFREKDPASPS